LKETETRLAQQKKYMKLINSWKRLKHD
jgi:hypothetical protein